VSKWYLKEICSMLRLMHDNCECGLNEGKEYQYWQKVNALKEDLELFNRIPEAAIDWARRLAMIKTPDREIVLRDVPVGERPYSLLQQANTALTQSCPPFVAWRLEWINGEVDRL
jgi:hypothetical protein